MVNGRAAAAASCVSTSGRCGPAWTKKGWGQAPVRRPYRSQMASPRRSDESCPARVHRGNVGSPEGSHTGQRAARPAQGAAGQRGGRQRRLVGQAAERDGRVLRASGRTAIRGLVTSASVEPTKAAKQRTAVATHAGAASRGTRVGSRGVSCRSCTSVTGCGQEPCAMLERRAVQVACAVLRGGKCCKAPTYPKQE